MALTTSGTLPGPVAAYYEKRFLMRAEMNFIMDQLGMPGRVPKNEGKTIVWNRVTNPSAKTTALTEGTDPTPTGLSATLLSATLSQYGNYEQVTDYLELTAIDTLIKEVMDTLAYEASLTIDTTVRDAVGSTSGQALLASGVAARNSLVSTNVVQVSDIRKAKRNLNRLFAKPHTKDRFVAIAHPDVKILRRLLVTIGKQFRKFSENLIKTTLSQAQKWEGATTIIGTSLLGRRYSLNYLAISRIR